ncbi:MAG: hypothetical protein ACK56W_14190 [Pirellula sp.]|jgi:hypothetical protein
MVFSQPLAICLLTALTASLIVLGWELCRFFNPKRLIDRRIELAFVMLGVFAAGVLAMEWIDGSHSLYDVSKRLFVCGVGLFGFLAVVLLGLFRFVFRERVYTAGRLFSPIFLLVFLGMSVVAYARFSFRCNAELEPIVGEYSIGQVEKDAYWIGETDCGTAIPLFHFDADDQKFQSFAQSFEGRFPSFSNTIISRQSADKEANCHGWVFTGGKFLVRGESVEKILEENGYRSVKEPAAGDVIIYRSIAGNILHTALVQAILNDGTVLAESKWGIDQRFIHMPEHQPYSSDFTYYRTNRRDHRILVHRVEDLENASLLDD